MIYTCETTLLGVFEISFPLYQKLWMAILECEWLMKKKVANVEKKLLHGAYALNLRLVGR